MSDEAGAVPAPEASAEETEAPQAPGEPEEAAPDASQGGGEELTSNDAEPTSEETTAEGDKVEEAEETEEKVEEKVEESPADAAADAGEEEEEETKAKEAEGGEAPAPSGEEPTAPAPAATETEETKGEDGEGEDQGEDVSTKPPPTEEEMLQSMAASQQQQEQPEQEEEEDEEDLAEMEAAAIKIQAAHRSKATRKKLQKEKAKKQEESVQSHWADSGLPEDRYLADGYYKRSQFDIKEEDIAGTQVAGLSLKQGLGFESTKRHNTILMEDDVLIYSTGKFLVLQKYSIGTRLYLPSLDGGGIGAIDVHPSRKYFCVCEKVNPQLVATGRTPNVYIYEYPSLRIYKVLPNGTERAYSACKFNQLDKGATLATVGSYPDFLLSVWNWEEEKMILRSKAFSQDIYSVQFSPKFEGQLITSGTGHIRFWKMAGTFTGLKLQGAIGKFGSVEISDVAAFAELPDGSVACGTESGDILVWDGGFIKTFFTLPSGKSCHKGMIEVARISHGFLMTGGMDGYLKFWDLKQVMELESEDEVGINCSITPVQQVLVESRGRPGKPVAIKSIVEKSKDRYIVQDHNGSILELAIRKPKEAKETSSKDSGEATGSGGDGDSPGTVQLQVQSSKAIVKCHSGNIVGLITSPVSHHMVTAGEDGSVRVYNYTQDTTRSLFEVSFPEPATILTGFPRDVDPAGRVCVVGFEDGVVRVLLRCMDGFKTLYVGKPHKDAITSAQVSPDGTYCVTGSRDKTLFFFSVKLPNNLTLGLSPGASMAIDADEDKALGDDESKPKSVDDDDKSTDGAEAVAEAAGLEWKPLAYIPTPDEVSSVSWHGESQVLLVGCTNGDILEVERPPLDVDTFKTFETQCKTRFYDFQKPKLLKKTPKASSGNTNPDESAGESTAEAGKDGAKGKSEASEGEGEKKQDGKGEESGESKEEDGEEVEESEEESASGYPVREVMYLNNGIGAAAKKDGGGEISHDFYASFGGKASGYVFLCNVDEDEVMEAIPTHDNASMTHLSFSSQSKYLLSGSTDGVVRICSLQSGKDSQAKAAKDTTHTGLLSDFVEVGMHSGEISCIATSFDESAIVTASSDGSCFIVKNFLDDDIHSTTSMAVTAESPANQFTSARMMNKMQEPPQFPLPTLMAEELTQFTEEIHSKTHYSIEDSKQKTDRDKKLSNAETKKAALREKVKGIRNSFKALLDSNMALPEVEQLSRSEFLIDLNLQEMLDKNLSDCLKETELEEAFANEKSRIGLEKIHNWFFADVEVERIVLHAFKSQLSASTFRTSKLVHEVQKELDLIKEEHMKEEKERLLESERNQRDGGDGGEGGELTETESSTGDASKVNTQSSKDVSERRVSKVNADGKLSSQSDGGKAGASAASAAGGGPGKDLSSKKEHGREHAREVEKKLNKQEMRREQRTRRELEWKQFNKTKPDEKFENPEDVAAIQTAIDNMGDFKLKSDPNYIAPEEERMNVKKKRRQLLLLDAEIYGMKMAFNKKFLSLRDLKKDLIAQIGKSNEKLTSLRKDLKQQEELFTPQMLPEELPELRHEVSQSEIDNYLEEERNKAESAGGGGGFGGFGAAATAAAKGGASKAKEGSTKIANAAKVLGFAKKIRRSSLAGERRFSAIAEFRASDVEIKEMLIKKKFLQHHVEKIEEQIRKSITDFDRNLDALRQEKFSFQADLKMAEIRRVILVKELAILKECEKRDTLLKNKMDTKSGEKAEIINKINSCVEKISEKNSEINKVLEKKNKILSEFDSLVEDGSTFRDQLQKIFLRKIKRHKKNAKRTEDFDSEEESDSEEEDDDDDDWDEDEAEEICPPGCDQSLYEKVCDLREKRLDQEEIDVELKKQLDTFNKEKESFKKKQNLINQAVKAINEEIISFQKEKQSKLNDIDLVITLKMHQIEYLVESKLPLDLGEALVFPQTTLKRLEERVGELIEEKAQLKQEQKELRKQHKQMLRDNKLKEGRINELQSKARDIQLLKFGQLIDLDLLDKMGVNKTTEDLKENLLRQEKQFIHDLAQWNKKIESAKRELADFTQENTNYLNKLAELTSSQRQIDLKLHSTQNELFTNPAAQRKKEIAQRDHLIEVINLQSQQIDTLKQEINLLRHKSGKL